MFAIGVLFGLSESLLGVPKNDLLRVEWALERKNALMCSRLLFDCMRCPKLGNLIALVT